MQISFRPISEKIQTSHKDLLKMENAKVTEYEELDKQYDQIGEQIRAELERIESELEDRAE